MPIKINGATSGSTTITAPATGSDESIELSTALASKLDLAGGKILQIVRATDSTLRTTSSTSFVDVTGMSVTITPQKSDSAIIVIATFLGRPIGTNTYQYVIITDSSNNPLNGGTGPGLQGSNLTAIFFQTVLVGYATPATTSATTYKLRFRADSGADTARIINNEDIGQMFAIEVSA